MSSKKLCIGLSVLLLLSLGFNGVQFWNGLQNATELTEWQSLGSEIGSMRFVLPDNPSPEQIRRVMNPCMPHSVAESRSPMKKRGCNLTTPTAPVWLEVIFLDPKLNERVYASSI